MEKKLYIAPQITAVSFAVERGYATSYASELLNPEAMNELFLGLEGDLENDENGSPMEDYNFRSGWYDPENDRGSFF